MPYGHLRAVARTLPFLLAAPGMAFAQPVRAPTFAEAQAALAPAPAVYSQGQLDQMLAPIALYPDQLLLALLMAATFPQQVIDAGQWLQDPGNAALSGDQLVAALQPLPWDPSVKSLVAFPQIIQIMNTHLDWTEALGTAFAGQQVAVMARVQFLRQRAAGAGRLASTQHLRVEHRDGDIIIEPENPAMIYVPVYNPAEVYGEWPDQAEPPIYLPPPPGFYVGAIGAGVGFSIGFGVAAPLWGWGHPDWRRHEVVVDRPRYDRMTNVTNITRNNIVIQNDTWHRTAPVVRVPAAQRPRPPAAAATAPHPPGTVRSTVVVLPRPAPAARAPAGPATHPPAPASAAPSAPNRPGVVAHPAPPPHRAPPAEVVHPAPPPHRAPPAEVAHPAPPPHRAPPAEVAHPAPPPHRAPPAEVAHPAPPPHRAPPAQVAHPAPPHRAPPAEAHPAPPPHGAPPAEAPIPRRRRTRAAGTGRPSRAAAAPRAAGTGRPSRAAAARRAAGTGRPSRAAAAPRAAGTGRPSRAAARRAAGQEGAAEARRGREGQALTGGTSRGVRCLAHSPRGRFREPSRARASGSVTPQAVPTLYTRGRCGRACGVKPASRACSGRGRAPRRPGTWRSRR